MTVATPIFDAVNAEYGNCFEVKYDERFRPAVSDEVARNLGWRGILPNIAIFGRQIDHTSSFRGEQSTYTGYPYGDDVPSLTTGAQPSAARAAGRSHAADGTEAQGDPKDR